MSDDPQRSRRFRNLRAAQHRVLSLTADLRSAVAERNKILRDLHAGIRDERGRVLEKGAGVTELAREIGRHRSQVNRIVDEE